MSNQEQLYSKVMKERLAALSEIQKDVSNEIPAGCWGSLNAWAVFLGPSPGGEPIPEEADLVMRPKWNKSTIGVGMTSQPFKDHKSRNRNWSKLLFSVLQDEPAVNKLSALYNLYWRHSRNEKCIPISELSDGCESVMETLELSRPRFVIALTKRTYCAFSNFLDERQYTHIISGGVSKFPIMRFRINNNPFDSYFVKSPGHPSWPLRKSSLDFFGELIRKLDASD